MKMDIKKVQEETKRLKLEMTPMYEFALFNYPEIVNELANGVGSETAWFYHLIPDTVWLLNINPSSHIHDWDYTLPFYFMTKELGENHFHEANARFLRNCKKQIADGSFIFSYPRILRCNMYYKAVESESGQIAFWSNKILPEGFPKELKKELDFDVSVLERYREIFSFLDDEMFKFSQGKK